MDAKELEIGDITKGIESESSIKQNRDPDESQSDNGKETDEDIIKEARTRCDDAEMECSDIYNDIKKNLTFVNNIDNGQWDDTLRTARETNPGGPLPCLTLNKLQTYANRVCNDYRMQRPGIKIAPKNDSIDKRTVEIAQGLVRSIINNGDSESAYDTALDNAATGGLGFYQVKTRYVDDDSFDQEIYLDRILNPLDVIFPIHLSKNIDFSDSDYCFVIKDISKDQYKQQYGEFDDSDWETRSIKSNWITDKTVRLAMYYRKKFTDETIYLLDDGSVSPQLPEGSVSSKSRTRKKITIEWYQLSAHKIHSRGTIPGEYLPIIPCIGKEVIDKQGKRRFKSLCQDAQDAQRMLNYWKSNVAQYYALAPKARWMIGAGQDEGYEHEYEASNTSNIIALHYKPKSHEGILLPPPQPIQQNQIAAPILEEISACDNDIKSIIGLPDVKMGNSKTERSGKAIKANQKEGELINYHFGDNQRKSMVAGWEVICSMIPVVYDMPRVIAITNNMMEQEQIKINAQHQDEKSGELRMYDMSKLKLKVMAEPGPSYSSRKEQTADFLMQLIQALPEIGPGMLDLVADAIGADQQIVDRCKMMLPPNLQQQVSAKDVPPAVRAVLQQMEKGIQQADFLIKQKDQMIQQLVAAVNDKSAERNAKLQTAVLKAETELKKAQIDAGHKVHVKHLDMAHEVALRESEPVPAQPTGGNENVPAQA